MTDTHPPLERTKRIVVSLDTSDRGRAALEAAVRLAVSTSAELQGMFVEDEDLVRLASLPFSREIEFASASSRDLQSVNVERALRIAAEEAQQAFADALQRVNLKWTFRTVRGTITQASLDAAGDVDLLVIGQRGSSPRVLAGDYLQPQRSTTNQAVVAIFDGSPSAIRTLELAVSLAEHCSLTVLVLEKNNNNVAHQCMSLLRHHNVQAEVDRALNPTKDSIIDFVKKWPPGVLLINRDSPFISDTQIRGLVNEFECPLILC